MYLFTRFLVAWIVFGIFFVIGVIVERNGKNIPYHFFENRLYRIDYTMKPYL